MIEGEDFYFNEQGLMVLTEQYHRNRGFCCGNACRHCPYDYENVSEQLRTIKLEERTKSNYKFSPPNDDDDKQ